jgi:hypothetical protein
MGIRYLASGVVVFSRVIYSNASCCVTNPFRSNTATSAASS